MSNIYKPRWTYNHIITEYLMSIYAAKEIVNLLDLPDDIEEKLKRESLIKTVHYSTKIEGNILDIEEVYQALESKRHSNRKDVQEVRNYFNALEFLDKKAEKNTPITESFIREVHGIIEIRSSGRRAKETPYRDGQNVIRDSVSKGIVYLPPESKDVTSLMSGLVQWLNDEENRDIPVPIMAAIASYQLVTIHPFWDGNGRTARALATYILKKENYDLKGFYSMEEFYDKDIQLYYDSLQMNLHHNYYFGRNNADLTQWIIYFLDIMCDVFEKVKRKVTELYYRKTPLYDFISFLNKRERWVVNYIKEKGSIRATEMLNFYTIDKKTAMMWLKKFEAEGLLKRKNPSQLRNVEFILTEKYEQIKNEL